MSKNATIGLVVGLVIGGLAVWLLMAFTGVGETMILRMSNSTKVKTSNPVVQQGQELTANGLTVTTPTDSTFKVSNVVFPEIELINNKTFTAKTDISGYILEKENGKKIATIEKILITDLSGTGIESLKQDPSAVVNTLSTYGENTSALSPKIESTNSADRAAARKAANMSFMNMCGTSSKAISNQSKYVAEGEKFSSALVETLGVDDITMSPQLVIEPSRDIEEFVTAMFEGNGIEYSGWWSSFFTYIGTKIGEATGGFIGGFCCGAGWDCCPQ